MNTPTRIRTLVAALAAVSGLAVALPAAAEVVASDGWVQATAPGARVGTGYLVLTNKGDNERALLRITSPVSDEISLHWASRDAQGAMRLWPLSRILLEPGESLRFEPQGRQVTFNNLKVPFEAGQKIPLKLLFDRGGPEITVMLEVRPVAAGTASASQVGQTPR